MTKDQRIKSNYIKIIAWLIANNRCKACGQCEFDNDSECDACIKQTAEEMSGSICDPFRKSHGDIIPNDFMEV